MIVVVIDICVYGLLRQAQRFVQDLARLRVALHELSHEGITLPCEGAVKTGILSISVTEKLVRLV